MTVRVPRLRPSTVGYGLLAAAATAPAWIVKHPPLQDLPAHLAILRVVHSYSDPAYGLQQDFRLDLLHTQYVLYYVLGSAFAYVLGVVKANVALMCLYLGGTVLAMRELLRALGKDERLCVFTLPLLVNVMFTLGFLPFVLGIPLLLLGVAATVRWLERPTRKRAIGLGVLAVLLFFMHLFAYGLFGIAFIALFPWARPRSWLRAGLPVVPSLVLFGRWLATSSMAHVAAGSLESGGAHPYDVSIAQIAQWSIDVFRDDTDEKHFVMAALVALAATALAQGDRDRSRPASRRYALLPLVCIVLYFTTGEYLGEVWLFAQRFPVLAMITAVPLLRMPAGLRGVAATGAAVAVGGLSIVNVCKHFIAFERQEVGDIDEAIEQMEPRRHVIGLIYDKGSSIMPMAPFLHYVSYYQVDKGGLVQFSQANIRYAPFHFRPGHAPPEGDPARLRWEWTPELVTIQELYPYYDYVLTRGAGFRPPPGTYRLKWHGDRWSVWEKG
jgi:hypothetical protein